MYTLLEQCGLACTKCLVDCLDYPPLPSSGSVRANNSQIRSKTVLFWDYITLGKNCDLVDPGMALSLDQHGVKKKHKEDRTFGARMGLNWEMHKVQLQPSLVIIWELFPFPNQEG